MRTFQHSPMDFRAMPPAVRGLIIANLVVFALGLLVGDPFFSLFGLVPKRVIEERWVWQTVTYLFIHGGFMHLLFNVFALWMFGVAIESQWGSQEFLKYYFLCGLGAAAATLALNPHSLHPVIGASGPVYGLLVAFAMLYPDAVVYLYFLIPVSAKHMAIIFGVLEFFAGATGATPGIARFAHLGGMVTGYAYLRWWWVLKIRAKAAFRDMEGGLKIARKPAQRRRTFSSPARENPTQSMEVIDRILDKILASGMESLSDEERAIMQRYSQQGKKTHEDR